LGFLDPSGLSPGGLWKDLLWGADVLGVAGLVIIAAVQLGADPLSDVLAAAGVGQLIGAAGATNAIQQGSTK
jgi:hypothetical protein